MPAEPVAPGRCRRGWGRGEHRARERRASSAHELRCDDRTGGVFARFGASTPARPRRPTCRRASGVLWGLIVLGSPACPYYDSSWGQAKTAQKNAAQHYSGARLGEETATSPRLPPRRNLELRRLKVQAVATREHAVQVVNWQARFREAVDRASPLLASALAVELDVVDGGIWRPAGDAEPLDALLAELERTHDGAGVDYVVGLVGALDRLEPSIHQLGVARLHGKHLVLRAANDALEYDAITQGFGELGREERDELYRSRRAHRASAVLIHELGHCLGAVHVQTPTELMYPRYGTEMSAISEPVAALMRITVSERALPPEARDPRRLAEQLREEFARQRAPWVPGELLDMDEYLASFGPATGGTLGAASAIPVAPAPPSGVAPPAGVGSPATSASGAPAAAAGPPETPATGLSPVQRPLRPPPHRGAALPARHGPKARLDHHACRMRTAHEAEQRLQTLSARRIVLPACSITRKRCVRGMSS